MKQGGKIVGRQIKFFFGLFLYALVLQGAVTALIAQPLAQPAEQPIAQVDGTIPTELDEEQLAPIAEIVEEAIRGGQIPGAVVVIGNQGRVVYRCAFGHRATAPEKLPMAVDTIFDVSSLTKVIATTPAVMQLMEMGKLRLEDPVAKYWPEFKANGKEKITVRELLTHYSGLQPGLDSRQRFSDYGAALKIIAAEKPTHPAGTRFLYSDINFVILGELVRRVSGQPLDMYCAEHVFNPLGMTDTGFRPSRILHGRIAPTQYQHGIGAVHDPMAYKMGGVAGHAGLFSTADDLSVFAQTLLDGGSAGGVRILSQLTVEKMTTPQNPPGKMALRGLGWDIDSPFASNRGGIVSCRFLRAYRLHWNFDLDRSGF